MFLVNSTDRVLLVIGGGARKWCRRRDQIDQRRRQHRDLQVHRHTIPLIDNDSGTALRRRVMFVGTLPQSPSASK